MNREKVIKGLEYCIKSENCRGCIYWEEIGLHEGCPLNSDALELLKEQDNKIRQLRLALQIMNGNGIRVDTEGEKVTKEQKQMPFFRMETLSANNGGNRVFYLQNKSQ